jgi:Protein of unknown function (DUF4089)
MKARRKSKSAKGKSAVRRKTVRAALPAAGASDPLDDFILSAARGLNLTIDNAWMPGVRANLKLTLMLGAQVGEFVLPDDAEPAPVFRA